MCSGAEPGQDRGALSRQFSWSRHGARFSTRSMIAHTSSTQATLRSRAFQTRPTPAARPHDPRQLGDRAVVVEPVPRLRDRDPASSDASRNGIASAVAATQRARRGTGLRNVARIPATGSTATEVGAGAVRGAG